MQRTETLKTLNVLALAALVLYPFFQKPALLYLCAFFLAIALTDNPLARLTAGAWLKFGDILGGFSSRLILGLVFYLLLTPLAFFYRLFNGASSAHFKADTRETLFEDVPPADFSKESFEKPW
ncbi:MAG TPA: SxtJ family membrane protein [Elusimicrobiales bacterium]|nr:SxtJ family membrane protein [Elusimicrobiales bacterium]